MSMGASLGNLGTATVNLTADDRELRQKLSDAETKIRAQVARNNLAIAAQRPLTLSADPAVAALAQVRTQTLISQNQLLQDKLDAVARAAARANAALADRAKAIAAARAQEEAEKAAARAATLAANQPSASTRATTDAAKAKEESRRVLAYRTQVFGQTLDDLQYVETMGLRPILNNIMAISPQVGIAMLLADQVIKKTVGSWGKLFEMLGYQPLKTVMETVQARIEVLNNKRVKISVDYNELDTLQKKLEKLQKAKEAFEGSKEDVYTKGLSKEAKDIAGGMPGGSEALEKAVFEMERTEGRTRLSPEDAQKFIDKRLGQKQEKIMEALQQEFDKVDREFAKEEVGKMLIGDEGAIERMKNRSARNPGAFAAKNEAGITAAEALAKMPGTKEELRKREADKVQNKLMEDWEKHEKDVGDKADHKAKEQKSEAKDVAKAMEDVFARDMIENIRTGKGPTDTKLRGEVAKHMEAAGFDAEKAKKLAADVVEALFQSMDDKIKTRALAEGISIEDAAGQIDNEKRKEQKEKADKKAGITDFKPEVMSLDSFFNSLLTRTPKDADEGTTKIVEAVDEGTKATQAIGKIMADRLSDRRAKYAR